MALAEEAVVMVETVVAVATVMEAVSVEVVVAPAVVVEEVPHPVEIAMAQSAMEIGVVRNLRAVT